MKVNNFFEGVIFMGLPVPIIGDVLKVVGDAVNGRNDVKKQKISAARDISVAGIVTAGVAYGIKRLCDTFDKKDEFEVGVKRGDNFFNARGKNRY